MTDSAPCPDTGAGITDFKALAERIFLNLPYTPTDQQIEVLGALARFCSAMMPHDSVFLLNGYAGTGKTSLMGALVRSLGSFRVPVVLMAPTGRAAKVFGGFAHHFATTIHRRIYRSPAPGEPPWSVSMASNNFKGAVFIVDEASMIGADGDESGRPGLLEDLIYYVYSGENCRMILVGDTAQLPPVGCSSSPAMDPARLKAMGLRVLRATITATVRQARDSGILYNATWLRKAMRVDPLPVPYLHLNGMADVAAVESTDLIDTLSHSYSETGISNTLVITRSNKTATAYNEGIRTMILDREDLLGAGERLLVVKNNYFWTSKVKGLDFIANGDIGEVERVIATEVRYGFRFADIELTLTDRTEPVTIPVKIILESLFSDLPAVSQESVQRLANAICMDPDLHSPDTPMSVRLKMLRTDPYYNALQVKYAYALTCHKSQGGQWADVYVDMGYIPPESQGIDFYRWLYTATTRATSRLYYINPRIPTK